MTEKQTAQLERIARRRTCYELALIAPDGRRWLVLYVHARNHRALLDCIYPGDACSNCAKNVTAAMMIASAPVTSWHWEKDRRAIATDTGWRMAFTGRTQREAIMEGEYQFVGDDQANVA